MWSEGWFMAKKRTVVRVSKYYGLKGSQSALDFVDVNLVGDTPVFVDPRALRLLPSSWGQECVSLLQHFFRTVIRAIRDGNDDRARILLRGLKEPNETRLGLSRGLPRGRGLGRALADDMWEALSTSAAVRSGLLVDLEDTALMVEGIDRDLVSDIATNIIRAPLILYTNEMCTRYGIPTESGVASGALWDPDKKEWFQQLVDLPIAGDYGKVLLVPKLAVRSKMNFDRDEYFWHYILTFLQEEELSAGSNLVRVLRDGTQWVAKKDLIKKYGSGKRLITNITRQHPEILDRYRRARDRSPRPPLGHEQLRNRIGTKRPDWEGLLDRVRNTRRGKQGADKYHQAVQELLTSLFYPALGHPTSEYPIHEGRKRIDISFDNVATYGFFWWVGQHYPAPHIFVECKNYKGDPANPELDQLAGRFSPSRGKVGILACRSFTNKTLFLQRCKDTSSDQRGFIIPVDDADLDEMVAVRIHDPDDLQFPLLKTRFEALL
jgi:hypothetical protein